MGLLLGICGKDFWERIEYQHIILVRVNFDNHTNSPEISCAKFVVGQAILQVRYPVRAGIAVQTSMTL